MPLHLLQTVRKHIVLVVSSSTGIQKCEVNGKPATSEQLQQARDRMAPAFGLALAALSRCAERMRMRSMHTEESTAGQPTPADSSASTATSTPATEPQGTAGDSSRLAGNGERPADSGNGSAGANSADTADIMSCATSAHAAARRNHAAAVPSFSGATATTATTGLAEDSEGISTASGQCLHHSVTAWCTLPAALKLLMLCTPSYTYKREPAARGMPAMMAASTSTPSQG